MLTLLADPPRAIYLVLAAALITSALIWLNRRGRRALISLSVLSAVTALFVLCDQLFESPREEAVRRVQAMMAAADHRDPDAFASHLAEKVDYQGEQLPVTFTRDELRRHAFWSLLRQFDVHVAAWDFAREDAAEHDANSVVIGFLAKGEAQGKPFPFFFRATFTRQSDGQFKLSKLESFDALQRANKRQSIPGLGSGN
jgi:hypothetical protein